MQFAALLLDSDFERIAGRAGMKTIDWTSLLSRWPMVTGYVRLLTGNTGGLVAVRPTFVKAPNVDQQFIGERGVQDGSVL